SASRASAELARPAWRTRLRRWIRRWSAVSERSRSRSSKPASRCVPARASLCRSSSLTTHPPLLERLLGARDPSLGSGQRAATKLGHALHGLSFEVAQRPRDTIVCRQQV